MRCGTGAVNRAESQAGAQGAAQGFSAVVRDAAPDVMSQVEALARGGQAIEAIKLLRSASNLGLREAKEIVDAIIAGQPVNVPPLSLITPSLIMYTPGAKVTLTWPEKFIPPQ